jgi:hypothetical protein
MFITLGTGNGSAVIMDKELFIGGSGNDIFIGRGGADLLRGNGGADTFRYEVFADSTLSNGGDSIVDFNQVDGDRFNLLTGAPASVSKAGTFTGTNLQAAVNALYASGEAPAINAAVFFSWNLGSTTRTYLTVNDGTVGFSSTADLLVNVTGIQYATGDAGLTGSLDANKYFS